MNSDTHGINKSIEAEQSMLELIKEIDTIKEVPAILADPDENGRRYTHFVINGKHLSQNEQFAFMNLCGVSLGDSYYVYWNPTVEKEFTDKTNSTRRGISKVKSKEQLHNIIKTLIGCIYGRINLNWLDVSELEDMSGLFMDLRFNGDISKWDVSKVKNMHGMFWDCPFNNDSISKWDVSNVEDMSYMFHGHRHYVNNDRSKINISKWDVSKVKTMECMFREAFFHGDISDWDVSNVENMSYMFCDSPFNKDISKWNVMNVKNMEGMFKNSLKLASDIDHKLQNLYHQGLVNGHSDPREDWWWYDWGNFKQDISEWDISKVENTKEMFKNNFVCSNTIKKWAPILEHVKEKENMYENTKIYL